MKQKCIHCGMEVELIEHPDPPRRPWYTTDHECKQMIEARKTLRRYRKILTGRR